MATLLYDSWSDDIAGTAVLIGVGFDENGEAFFDDLTAAQENAVWDFVNQKLEE